MLAGMSAEMTYGHLGRSGLLVSRIGLGTMNFGYTVDESSSFAVMDAAIDAGINFFDTADVYGGPQSPDMEKGYGIAEETVGRWLQRSGQPRRHRAGHEGVPADGTRPERPPAVGLPHPARVRGEPAAAADRSHRPVPDAPRRPGHAVGGDLAGDGAAGPRGQDQLRRQQQLRRLGRRPRPVAPPRHGTSWA